MGENNWKVLTLLVGSCGTIIINVGPLNQEDETIDFLGTAPSIHGGPLIPGVRTGRLGVVTLILRRKWPCGRF